MRNMKHNIYIKLAAIIVLTLLLLIPSAMVMDLIREREQTQEDAINEVAGVIVCLCWGTMSFVAIEEGIFKTALKEEILEDIAPHICVGVNSWHCFKTFLVLLINKLDQG